MCLGGGVSIFSSFTCPSTLLILTGLGFYINLPIGGLCALLLILVHVPDTNPKPPLSFRVFRELIPELDLFGFALFAPAAVMFLLALQFGGKDYAWGSSVVIGLFCGSGAMAILFCLWEYRMGDRAMMPGFLVKQRIVLCSLLHMGLTMTLVTVPSYFLPSYFQSVLGTSPTMSGVDLLPSILSQLLFIVLAGVASK